MSFRARLTLFFVLIVALPMVALAVLVTQVATDSAEGKTDARLDAGLQTATNLFDRARADSGRAANELAQRTADDPAALEAIREGDVGAVLDLARTYAREEGVGYVSIVDSAGRETVAGDPRPIAGAEVDLVGEDGEQVGTITVSTIGREEFLREVEAITGEEAALVGQEGAATGAADVDAASLPDGGEAADLERDGEDLRVAATEPLGAEQVRVALFAPAADEGFLGSRPAIAIALLAFFVVALLAVGLILRSLQGYVREMLGAARRIGEGDFSQQVPVSGNDEMAGLAKEFNKMSGRLSDQMDQLRRQRVEIDKSVRRVGDAFASGLDRQALLAILVETAVGTCEADYGLVALSGHVGAEAEAGKANEPIQEAALAAEEQALRDPGPVEVSEGDAHAFASSLGRIGASGAPVGAMTIARAGRPFTSNEREVFLYLVGQAAASVENIALHELVSEQAVTDDLTDLANSRAFREAVDREAARAARFRQELSLLILDLDDFKRINDEHGHPAGDAVLRAVGRILAGESRGIDTAARYGGEEFVVALPETSPDGALEVAERIRAKIEAERVPLPAGGGEVRVTASLGLATLPAAAIDAHDLIAAADAALYEAKRGGKNRVVVARPSADGRPAQRRSGGRGSREGSGARAAKVGSKATLGCRKGRRLAVVFPHRVAMGILDDAIREHLDLKRRLGAEEDELKRLEGEAFGPPTRPGDPDFPQQDAAGEATAAEAVTGEEPAAPPAEPPPTAEPPSEELAAAAPPTDPGLAPPPTGEEPVAPATEDAPPAGFYDQSGDDIDLELDVDLEGAGPARGDGRERGPGRPGAPARTAATGAGGPGDRRAGSGRAARRATDRVARHGGAPHRGRDRGHRGGRAGGGRAGRGARGR